MVYYEIKKVFSKTSNKIAVLILIFLLGLVSSSAVHVEYTNEEGNHESGNSAIHKLKEMKKEWAGELTEEKLMRVIEENARIQATPEAQSKDIQQQNIAYNWMQVFDDIRTMFANSYGGFREHDYFVIDYLKPEDAAKFYSNRVESLKEYLYSPEQDIVSHFLSEKEKAFLIKQYEEMETPLKYEDFMGWDESE